MKPWSGYLPGKEEHGTVEMGGLKLPSVLDVRNGRKFVDLSSQAARDYADKATEVQLTSPLLSTLVVGQMQKRASFIDYFAPPLTVTKVTNDYPTWPDSEWMAKKETLRAERAQYQTSGTTPSQATIVLERHSWALQSDQRVLNNADAGLGIAEKYAGFAARIVRKSLEYKMADLAVAAGSFDTNHDVTLVATEWDAAADAGVPFDDVNTGVSVICDAVGCEPRDLKGYMPQSSRIALQSNAQFQSWNKGDVMKVDQRPETGFAAFFGIGEVLTENAWGKTGPSGTEVTGPIFADIFILFLPGVSGDYDSDFGEIRWLTQLRMNAGVASDPWFDRNTTTWNYPWDEEVQFVLLDNKAAYIIRNTVA